MVKYQQDKLRQYTSSLKSIVLSQQDKEKKAPFKKKQNKSKA